MEPRQLDTGVLRNLKPVMTRAPKVSVLMTVHNAGPFLREAVDSILAQTFSDWELVVIENGSTDDSPAILASYTDPRINVSPQKENVGRTRALRAAFAMARGNYIAILDADDIAQSERLEAQVAYLDDYPDIVLLGTWARFISENGQVIKADAVTPPTDSRSLYDHLGWGNPFVHSSVMYRATQAADVGGYPEELAYAQDCGLWLKLAQRGGLGMIPKALCDYRVLQTGLTQAPKQRELVARDCLALLYSARRHLALGEEALRRNCDEIFINEVKCGVALIRRRALTSGVRTLIMAMVRNPIGPWRTRARYDWFIRTLAPALSRNSFRLK